MSRVVVISSCLQCPMVEFIPTRDQEKPRIYVACGKCKRSFDYEALTSDAPKIPLWCPLPLEKGNA